MDDSDKNHANHNQHDNKSNTMWPAKLETFLEHSHPVSQMLFWLNKMLKRKAKGDVTSSAILRCIW